MFPSTKTSSIEQEGRTFSVYAVEFENAIFSFFFEGKDRKVGTLAVATPQTTSMIGSSSVLLGYKNAGISRLLAEYLAAKFKKTSISSVSIHQENDTHAHRILLKLAQSTQEKSTNSKTSEVGGGA